MVGLLTLFGKHYGGWTAVVKYYGIPYLVRSSPPCPDLPSCVTKTTD